MRTVGAYEAKTHLPSLLEQVEQGETITITRHGVEVARLIPVSPTSEMPDTVIQALRAARSGVRIGRLSVREMVQDGRR